MIQQLVRLAKLRTDDGHWNFENAQIKTGLTFWVDCNSFEMKSTLVKNTGERFTTLMVKTEENTFLPAEILEYTSEFRIKQ
jgi:hypothetical protein